MQTVDDARKMLFNDRELFRQGQHCPSCDQFVKLYRRQVTSTAAKMLWNLYRMDRFERDSGSSKIYHYVGDLVVIATGTSDFSKLKYWGLVVEMENDDSGKKRTSGYYAITEKGKRFVDGDETISQYVLLYNSRSYGFEGKQVTYEQVVPKEWISKRLIFGFRHRHVDCFMCLQSG